MSIDEKIIKAVESYVFLYDKRHELHKNNRAIENAWREISEEVGESVDDVKKRWINLKKRFSEARRRLKNPPSGLGTQATITTWPLYNSLLFLDKHMATRRTTSSVKEETHSTVECGAFFDEDTKFEMQYCGESTVKSQCSDGNSMTGDPPTAFSTAFTPTEQAISFISAPVRPEQARSLSIASTPGLSTPSTSEVSQTKSTSVEESIESTMAMMLQYFKRQMDNEESDDIFGKFVAKEMSKIKNGRIKRQIKLKIHEILNQGMDEDEL